ncbi:MAG: thioesterase family protein [Myxococcota bacterium]
MICLSRLGQQLLTLRLFSRNPHLPRFLHFFHCAFEDMFEAAGVPYRECLETDKVGWPAVHVDVDFQSPLRFGDVFLIDVWAESLGERSAAFAYRGRVGERDVASARVTVACVDLNDFRAQPIPDKYREIFERFPGPPAK